MTSIIHIETIVPDFCYSQSEIAETMKELTVDRKAQHYLNGLYSDSGIESRYSVLPDFGAASLMNAALPLDKLFTGDRNKIFADCSRKLISKLATNAFRACSSIKPSEVTHIITVSCTGFYNPGPDLQLISEFGIPETAERYNLGFMGCYAAFPALRLANTICKTRPDAKVVVLCLELCTLHFQNSKNLDALLANSIFADGAAMVLIDNSEDGSTDRIELESFSSQLLQEAESDMAWTIGNHGFDMVLSRYIPKLISANISGIVSSDLDNHQLKLSEIDLWAVHPGGKSILDKVQECLNLLPEQISTSREVLRNFGNMSSVTILFILKEMMKMRSDSDKIIYGLAFGPGLTIESAIFKYISSI